MTSKILGLSAFALCITFAASSFADEIEYDCSGSYDSKQSYDELDPMTVSVKATLTATMLGDSDAQGHYILTKAKLEMTATNFANKDAGSLTVTSDLTGNTHHSKKKEYDNTARFALGSNGGEAYKNLADIPTTYLLIPLETESDDVYVLRQGSGHDVYPPLKLHCKK